MSSFINWLNRKRIIPCDLCGKELNIYAYQSDDSLILLCPLCKQYYFKSDATSPIVKYDLPEGLRKIFDMDPDNKYYIGGSISEAYEPRWIKVLRKLLH
ncbi:hypothetical protein AB4Z45_23070 [Paenibacillus sp. MCAF9]|uniref:hypothetical protein n=1 Tax=Paenibacillus sp. MCAF9 TaxID=3233046 RepID=UPI003F998549